MREWMIYYMKSCMQITINDHLFLNNRIKLYNIINDGKSIATLKQKIHVNESEMKGQMWYLQWICNDTEDETE